MNISKILEEWEADSKVDISDLASEALKIPLLHGKYWRIFSLERYKLKKKESELAKLRLKAHEVYTLGPTREDMEQGWTLPPQGKLRDRDLVEKYLSTDPRVIEETLKVALQREKVELLESILREISGRSWEIGHAISWMKFKNGLN